MKCIQCPAYTDYYFRTHCKVTTCAMYTDKTKRKCLTLDTRFASDKVMSDTELRHYKRPDLTTKDITVLRKRTVNRAHAVIALRSFVVAIKDFNPRPINFNAMPNGVLKIVERMLKSKAFRIKPLGLEVWMIQYVFDKNVTDTIQPDIKKFYIQLLMKCTTAELKTVTEYFTSNSYFKLPAN